MPASQNPVLELRDVSKRFGGVGALSSVSFSVSKGEICGIIGPNGAGKSTLLSIISGYLRPSRGDVFYQGRQITRMPLYRRARAGIARTFQLAHTFNSMTVQDNILVGAERHGWFAPFETFTGISFGKSQGTAQHTSATVLEQVGLRNVAQAPASHLTFGQQRMLATGRALASSPVLLLLDEPAAGLSGKDIQALALAIRAARQGGVTVLLVEHNMDVIMQLCDHVIVLHLGEKIGDGRPEQVRQSEEVVEAYLGA